MRFLLHAVLTAFLVASSPATADNAVWNWLWIVPSPDPSKGWVTFTGQAKVNFDGRLLDATLEGHGEWDPTLHVSGRVMGRRATVTVTQIGTDANPETYSGAYVAVRTRPTDASNGWGEDRVSVQNGTSYLALYRAVRSPN